jgi:2-iminobutanoate/2-iminopropanoate deaminase
MKTVVSTDKAPAAIGPYSQAIRIGQMLFTSGQIPLDPQSGAMVGSEIREQTRQVLKNLKGVVEAGGGRVDQIIKTTVFVIDLGQFAALNEEYENFFKEFGAGAPHPARSTVQVAALPKGSLVEIEAIVAL